MVKRIAVLMSLALVLGAVVVPANAKPKKVKESFDAIAAPYPNGSYDEGSGCYYAVEMVHRVSHEVEVPFSGTLTVDIAELVGDWDLFIVDDEGDVITESSGSSGEPEHTENRVKKGQVVTIVVCNWAGEPQITVDYEISGG